MMDEPSDQTREPLPTDTILVDGRQCGTCTLCCKLLGIKEIDKPDWAWCVHCTPGRGCGIYETRPAPCRKFFCGYRQSIDIGEHWFPARSRMVLRAQGIGILCYVDPGYPNAWRQQPYHGDLRAWARRAVSSEHHVIVNVGGRTFAVLPDKDVDLGIMQVGEKIVVAEGRTPTGSTWDAYRVPAGPLQGSDGAGKLAG